MKARAQKSGKMGYFTKYRGHLFKGISSLTLLSKHGKKVAYTVEQIKHFPILSDGSEKVFNLPISDKMKQASEPYL